MALARTFLSPFMGGAAARTALRATSPAAPQAATQRRSIVTYANPSLRRFNLALSKRFPLFRADLASLEASPHTYRFAKTGGGGSYSPAERRINIASPSGVSSWRRRESAMHETHHAAQHDDHSRRFTPDVVDQIWSSSAHRTAMELSALATGKGGSSSAAARAGAIAHWRAYPGQPGYGPLHGPAGALSMLRSKYHVFSMTRLAQMGFRTPKPPGK